MKGVCLENLGRDLSEMAVDAVLKKYGRSRRGVVWGYDNPILTEKFAQAISVATGVGRELAKCRFKKFSSSTLLPPDVLEEIYMEISRQVSELVYECAAEGNARGIKDMEVCMEVRNIIFERFRQIGVFND